ncbi:MAG: deoxyguanosinetriphosphate triphosphohydrolase [Rubrivivax sp.]|jgi:dGTPase
MQTQARLARWASHPARTRGRRVPEAADPARHDHQRDRDRIVHSTAFRRLVYKTQVFINHEGDLFRTRLTHSLEVAQLARSMARMLSLNEDLVEAIALAHDLGHTPFGHAGQDALAECMRPHGGFEHNLQSLRVVDHLEARYAAFDGLNLTFETREGILKHCARKDAQRLCDEEPEGPARRFLHGGSPSLEAQLVNLADEVAYNAHDIDDGIRSGLLQVEQLAPLTLFARSSEAVEQAHAGLAQQSSRRFLAETVRHLLARQVHALVSETRRRLADAAPQDEDAVRGLPRLVGFDATIQAEITELKQFLFRSLYRHPRVTAMTARARTVVQELFDAYRDQPGHMPPYVAALPDRPRAVADYIAGMTDRFALREHQRLTGRQVFGDAG